MANIEIPNINTEVLFDPNATFPSEYHSRPFMSESWQTSLKYFEKFNKFADRYQPQYFVKKELTDRVTIQIAYPDPPTLAVPIPPANGRAELYIEDCRGARTRIQPIPYNVAYITGDVDANGDQLARVTFSFKIEDYIAAEGNYAWYIKVVYADSSVQELIGVPMSIKTKHENTLYFTMTHSENDYDFFFNNKSILLYYRIDGNITFNSNKLERTTFRNQKANLRQLYARNWRVFDLELGFPGDGINSYDQDKVYNYFKLDETYIDGVRYLMEEEAEFERIDYANRFPLRKLKTQLVEYDRSDSTLTGSLGDLFLMDLGALRGFPYLVETFTFTGIGSPGDDFFDFLDFYAAFNKQAEILDVAAETAFLDQLALDATGAGMTGSFYIDSGKLFYERGDGETYTAAVNILGNAHIVNYQTSPLVTTIGLIVFQTGKASVTIRDSAGGYKETPDLWIGDFTTAYDTLTDYDDYTLRLYTDNSMTFLQVDGVSSTNKNITAISGSVSTSLAVYSIFYADLGTWSFEPLLMARYNIAQLNVIDSNISAWDFTEFTIVGDTGRWQDLKVINFSQNQLGFAEQDDFYINYYPIAFAYRTRPPFIGFLDTRFQTPPSSPTSASLSERTLITSYGFTISF